MNFSDEIARINRITTPQLLDYVVANPHYLADRTTRTWPSRLSNEPLDLNEIVQASVESCKPVIEEKCHEVQLLLQPTPLMVNGEASKLMQVVVNLVTNAARYTPTRGHIWVKTTTEGSEAVLRVEDDGAGIPADMLKSVFDLFTQVESGGNKAHGLGVGLTLVRDYVDLHGGSVQATSDGKNKGSQFTVRIPLLQSS